MIQQAYVEGVSTRRQVVENFLGRPLDGGPYPYVWLDALTQKVREGGRPPQADQLAPANPPEADRTHFMTNLLTRVP